MAKKTAFETFHDAITGFSKEFNSKNDYISSDAKYVQFVKDTKEYITDEIRRELAVMEHLKETGLYTTNFFDPWYSTGYYLNSCVSRLSYYKGIIDDFYLPDDIPEVYYSIPKLERYPDDLIIGLKGYYKEILEMHENFYKSDDFAFIQANFEEYISQKYSDAKKRDAGFAEKHMVSRVNALHKLITEVNNAGGIDAVESGHYPDLKLNIRFYCSPVSKEEYRRCMGLRYEIDNLLFAGAIHSEESVPPVSNFIEKIKNLELPDGQISLFDLGLTA